MASVSLAIRKDRKGGAKVILKFNYGRKKCLRYATPYKLNNYNNWVKSKARIKIVDDEPDAENLNGKIAQFVNHAEKLIRIYDQNDTILDNAKIKNDLEDHFKPKGKVKKSKTKSVLKYFDDYIDFYSKHPRPTTQKPYGKGTLKTLRNSLSRLTDFEKEYGHLEFNDIDLDFHGRFLDYLTNKDYSLNYQGTIIKNLKAVLNDAYEKDYHQNLTFKKSAFTKPSEEVDKIYLTEDEIEKIHHADLKRIIDQKHKYFEYGEVVPSYDYFSRCRDFFLIECYTALKVSDILKLNENNIVEFDDNGQTIKALAVKTSKTSQPVEIPLKSSLEQILKKYNWGFPKKVVDSRINKYIKKIGQACEIDDLIEKKTKKNGKSMIENVPKYKLISNHTARRSFCTNAYKRGMHPIDIMTFSGHKTEKAFLKYIKASPRDRFSKVKNHPFFD
jgi:site-specific recombinase XerD